MVLIVTLCVWAVLSILPELSHLIPMEAYEIGTVIIIPILHKKKLKA